MNMTNGDAICADVERLLREWRLAGRSQHGLSALLARMQDLAPIYRAELASGCDAKRARELHKALGCIASALKHGEQILRSA